MTETLTDIDLVGRVVVDVVDVVVAVVGADCDYPKMAPS